MSHKETSVNVLFKEFIKHIKTKKNYFSVFAYEETPIENWVICEFLYVIHSKWKFVFSNGVNSYYKNWDAWMEALFPNDNKKVDIYIGKEVEENRGSKDGIYIEAKIVRWEDVMYTVKEDAIKLKRRKLKNAYIIVGYINKQSENFSESILEFENENRYIINVVHPIYKQFVDISDYDKGIKHKRAFVSFRLYKVIL